MYKQDMSDGDRIAALEAEVKALCARVDDLFEALKFESNSTTRHFGKLFDHIRELREYVFPAVHKLFPGMAAAERQLADILERRPPNTKKN
jgi:hypothetical protein